LYKEEAGVPKENCVEHCVQSWPSKKGYCNYYSYFTLIFYI